MKQTLWERFYHTLLGKNNTETVADATPRMAVPRFDPGDRVRVDIPNESDPDFDVYTVHGTIVEVRTDDAGRVTGHDRDSILYRVRLDCGEKRDFRGRDLRPPLE